MRIHSIGISILVLVVGCIPAPVSSPTAAVVQDTPTPVMPTVGVTVASATPTATILPSEMPPTTIEPAFQPVTNAPTVGALPALTRPRQDLHLTIIYDNVPPAINDSRLRAEWGFAAWLEYGDQVVLFDTGGDSQVLLANMEALGLDPQAIDVIVLSHEHGDHTEGLWGLLALGIKPPIYLPARFSTSFKQRARAYTEVVEMSDSQEILPGLHTTGQMGTSIIEQGLVIETPLGLVVLTGCAHPGIVQIVRRAQEILPGEIAGDPTRAIAWVVGGFHLMEATSGQIRNIMADLRALGVQRLTATHCTGESAIAAFAADYADYYVSGGVGRVISLPPVPDVTVCAAGCDFATIQAAIDADETVTGTVIGVAEAIHTEEGIVVHKSITIQGEEEQTIVQAHAQPEVSKQRVFAISPGVTVTLRLLTIRHGNPYTDPESGGGVRNDGTLTLDRCIVTANRASAGGGIHSDGTLTLIDSVVEGNASRGGIDHHLECETGGGIKVLSGVTILVNSRVSHNEAMGKGGGFHIACVGRLISINSMINDNYSAQDGGGIFLNGAAELTHTTITANEGKNGGGIYVEGSAEHDVIRGWLAYTGTLIVDNVIRMEKYGAADCFSGDHARVAVNNNNIVGDGDCELTFPEK
ncbi:MAG: MBL fold metallo-hydrolase [Anaerolineae bacterium]|nr:MBL fold metallo-hydrolase [Anaerolineae bacterium]